MPMTQERFDELLNVLPPCQWMRQGGIEHFYVSERISGEVVQYCVRFGQAFWGLCDRAGLTTAEIAQRIQAAEAAQAVFDAVAGDQFYVVSHPQMLVGVQSRLDDILALRNPSDPFAAKPHLGAALREQLRTGGNQVLRAD